jgi:hypothetical protein
MHVYVLLVLRRIQLFQVGFIPHYLHGRDGSQQRPHHPRFLGLVIRLTSDLRLGAARGFHGGARGACLWLRALNHGAARARAGRAFTDLTGLITGADTWRARRYCGFQDVFRHIGRCGALRLQHIPAHIRLRRARRNRGLQHILRPIDLRTSITVTAAAATATTAGRRAALMARLTANGTGRLRYINESLRACCQACDHYAENNTNK